MKQKIILHQQFNLGTYILSIAIFIAIGFISYFSLTTKNMASDAISFLLIVFFSFPIGIISSRLLFPEKCVSETIIISLCLGVPFSAGIWGIMAFLRIPINPVVYFSITFALPIVFSGYYWKKLCFKNKIFDVNELFTAIVVLLIGFLWHSLMWANKNVPPDVDAQGPMYLQLLIKEQGYPVVYPFLNEIKAYINYPPCFNTIVVLLSKIKMSLVYKECMSVTVVCGSYFILTIFLFSYCLSNKNVLLAFIAGILAINRAYLTQYNDGNTTEMLSFLSVVCFLFLLQQAFNKGHTKHSIIIAIPAGFIFSVSAFSQTEIFNWYAISLAVFFPFYFISKNKNCLKDYLILIVAVISCIAFVLPWLSITSGNYKTVNFENLFNQMATHLIPTLKYWHNPVFLILSFAGIGIFFFRREKIMVFLAGHSLIMAALIIHWKFYHLLGFKWFQFTPTSYWSLGANGSFTTPFQFPNTFTIGWMSFTIVFPIASSYTLITIIGCIKKTKIGFWEKHKALFMSIIFLSVFLYYEYKSYIRYPEWLLETDYQALQWFQKNTTFDSCLILNPRNPINVANGINYWSSDWVPVIAERRAISSRSLDTASVHMKITETDLIDKNELLAVYNNILQPGAYDILKKSHITHIFISALQSGNLIQDYQKASFLELAHYYSIPNLGTAVIYKVK